MNYVFPKDEKFGIISQMRRALVSIVSNISGGLGRTSRKEQARFMEIAYSSLLEVLCQMEVSRNLNFLGEKEFDLFRLKAIRISSMLIKLKRHS